MSTLGRVSTDGHLDETGAGAYEEKLAALVRCSNAHASRSIELVREGVERMRATAAQPAPSCPQGAHADGTVHVGGMDTTEQFADDQNDTVAIAHARRVLREHGDHSATSEDGGSVAQLTLALRGLLDAQRERDAETWDEGRDSFAADMMRPLRDDMTREQTPNPYRQ